MNFNPELPTWTGRMPWVLLSTFTPEIPDVIKKKWRRDGIYHPYTWRSGETRNDIFLCERWVASVGAADEVKPYRHNRWSVQPFTGNRFARTGETVLATSWWVSRKMWGKYEGIRDQGHHQYPELACWADKQLYPLYWWYHNIDAFIGQGKGFF